MRGWFCEHRGAIAIGPEAAHWEMYCKANRRCEVGPSGCHSVKVEQGPECQSEIHAGPGHQSRFPCVRRGPAHHHHYEYMYGYTWSSCQARENGMIFSGFSDQPPGHCEEHDDDGSVLSE